MRFHFVWINSESELLEKSAGAGYVAADTRLRTKHGKVALPVPGPAIGKTFLQGQPVDVPFRGPRGSGCFA